MQKPKKSAAGRPAVLEGSTRVNLWLSSQDVAIAKQLGGGNMSEGVRAALVIAKNTKKISVNNLTKS